MDYEHVTYVPPFNRERKSYHASCSCGWVGKTCETRGEADNDADEHVIASVRAEDMPRRRTSSAFDSELQSLENTED